MGFTTYKQPAPAPQPTLAERIALLSGAQKTAVLEAFATDVNPGVLKHNMGIAVPLIDAINREISEIEEECRAMMREEIVLEEAVIDPETGEEISPAVYNDAPADLDELKSIVSTTFDEVFTEAQVGAIINKMVEYSELDASGAPIGTAAVYAAEVIK